MDAAITAYLQRKDESNAETVLKEKKRLLIHPNSIDLLATVEVSKDAIAGGWELKNDVLTLVNPLEISIFQIPYEPGPEYNLHLTIERLEGKNYLALGLLVSGKPCTLMFDGWPDSGYKSGIQMIDGKFLLDNGTSVTGQRFPLHKVVQLDVSVRKDSIIAWVKGPDDGEKRQVVNYTGPQDHLSFEKDWVKGIRNEKALFLHLNTAKFAISTFALDPVGRDAGKPAR